MSNFKKLAVCTAAIALVTQSAHAQQQMACAKETAAIEAAAKKYEPDFQSITDHRAGRTKPVDPDKM